jgi:hypothetical protein
MSGRQPLRGQLQQDFRVKTAMAQPEAVQKTIITRVSSTEPSTQERKTPEFWDYVENLTPEDWERHIVYLYRMDPRSSNYGIGESSIDKFVGVIEMPAESQRRGFPAQVPLNDREECELAIREKHGGRAFRLIVKRNRERITEGKISNDAPPKYYAQDAAPTGTSSTAGPVSEASATADVAKVAMSTMAGQERQAVSVGIEALTAASQVIKNFANDKPVAASSNPAMDRLMELALTRLLNPPDPLEMFTKFMQAMQAMNSAAGPAAVPGTRDPLVQKILDTGLERVLNPPPSGPSSSAGAELVRSLPSVATYVTEAIREWRIGQEAQRDTAAMMTGAPRPAAAPTAASSPQVLPPAPRPNPDAGAATMPGPSIEFIESKIVEIFKLPTSTEQAADDTLAFLSVMSEDLVKQLVVLGEPGLVNLFQTRPILRQATQNMPRLIEFIRAFLKLHAENEAAGLEPPPAPDPASKPN